MCFRADLIYARVVAPCCGPVPASRLPSDGDYTSGSTLTLLRIAKADDVERSRGFSPPPEWRRAERGVDRWKLAE